MSRPGAVVAFHVAEVGGPLRSLERELAWLAERCELTVAIPDIGRAAPALAAPGWELVRGPYRPLELPRSPGAVARLASASRREVGWFRGLLRARGAEIAIAVTSTVPAILLASRLEGIPAVVSVAELWGGGRGALRSALGRCLLALEAGFSSEAIACSAPVAAQLPASTRVTVVTPPVAEASAGDGAAFRRAHGIPAGAPCVACIGSITAGRGQDVLIRALPRILERWEHARCVIQGDPFPRDADVSYSAALDRLASDLGVREAIVRLRAGGVEDLLGAASVVVNPATAPEAFGRVALEAGMAGVPAVCSGVGAIPELLRHRETALLVPAADAAALAEAVGELLSDPELGGRLASGAADLARAVADPDRSLRAFQRVVERVLA